MLVNNAESSFYSALSAIEDESVQKKVLHQHVLRKISEQTADYFLTSSAPQVTRLLTQLAFPEQEVAYYRLDDEIMPSILLMVKSPEWASVLFFRLQQLLKAEYKSCMAVTDDLCFVIRNSHGDDILRLQFISGEFRVVADYDEAGRPCYSESYPCEYNEADPWGCMEDYGGWQAIIKQLFPTKANLNSKAEFPLLEIEENIPCEAVVSSVLQKVQDIFAAGPGATNKVNKNITPEEMCHKAAMLSNVRTHGYLSANYYGKIIAEGIGDSEEQARIADAICQYNGIDSYLLTYETEPTYFSHTVCVASFDDCEFIIDPWAGITSEITNNNHERFYAALKSRFQQWYAAGEQVVSEFAESSFIKKEDIDDVIDDLKYFTLSSELSDELYTQIQKQLQDNLKKIYH